MPWKRGCVFGLQVCGFGGCGLVNITAYLATQHAINVSKCNFLKKKQFSVSNSVYCVLHLLTMLRKKWHHC